MITASGYFTLARYILGLNASRLEVRLGFSPGALASGWLVTTPATPISAGNLSLRGSTRWSGGTLTSGANIADLIAARSDTDLLRDKVSTFLGRGYGNRPVKLFRRDQRPITYPDSPDGVPQFEVRSPIAWRVVMEVGPGEHVAADRLIAALT